MYLLKYEVLLIKLRILNVYKVGGQHIATEGNRWSLEQRIVDRCLWLSLNRGLA
jgi:hypothetical protein